MSFNELLQSSHDIKRLREIVHVFFEQGFDYFIYQSKLKKFIPFKKRLKRRVDEKIKDKPMPVRVRLAFEQLGPVFIKFGQLLSLRPDIVPPEYIREFEKMQDKVPPFSSAEAKKIVEQELGKGILRDFSERPISAASLGQVHTAKVKGKKVAVKVQRPGIKETIDKDISILKHFAVLLQRHVPEFAGVDLLEIVTEFERWTYEELDYQTEAMHCQVIGANFADSKDVYIPRVYRDLTTKRVLTMEYVEGIPINQVERIKRAKVRLHDVLGKLLRAEITQVYSHGIFHADPHPANILYCTKRHKLVFIDFGIIGNFDEKLKRVTAELMKGVLSNDVPLMIKSLLSLGVMPKKFDEDGFRRDLQKMMLEFKYVELKDIDIARQVNNMLALVRKYHIKVPLDYILFSKMLVTLDGIGLRYDPDFKLAEKTKPLIERSMKDKMSFKRAVRKAGKVAGDYASLVESLPEQLNSIIAKVKKGEIGVDIDNADVRALTNEMEISAGNLSMGLVCAALIICAAMLIDVRTNFIYDNFPWFSAVLFFVVVILLVWLLERTIFKR